MKYKNMNGESLLFPLAEGQEIVNGAIYEIVSGKAQKATTVTGNLFGVCKGGDKIEKGMVMLDINPTSIFREAYTELPTIGTFVGGCKLVIAVDEDAEEYEFILRKMEKEQETDETDGTDGTDETAV